MKSQKFEDANRYLVNVNGVKVPTIAYVFEQSQAQRCRIDRIWSALWGCLLLAAAALIIAVIAIAR